jgi:hypothetical protein
MRFGFEREYFISVAKDRMDVDSDSMLYCLCPPELPHDECGYLAEARGLQQDNPRLAAFALLAEESRMRDKAKKLGVDLLLVDTVKLPVTLRREALRLHGKEQYPSSRFNMYGKDLPPNDRWDRAGLHVHFSNEEVRTFNGCKECRPVTYTIAGMVNIPFIVHTLDKAFEKQIKAARRLPGFYELKPYGFEYRSLPTTVDVVEVARIVEGVGL